MTDKTLRARYEEAEVALRACRHELDEILQAHGVDIDGFETYDYDPYDGEIYFTGRKPDWKLTPEAAKALGAAGFTVYPKDTHGRPNY